MGKPVIASFEGLKCQEASMYPGLSQFQCGRAAVAVVWHDRDHRAYMMCDMCADHNVRNRGGQLVAAAKGVKI